MVVNTHKNQLYVFTMLTTDFMKVSAILSHSTSLMASKRYCNGTGCSVSLSIMHAHK